MPYNSSSFEKQLAKYKAAQAVKAVAEMPVDKHRVQSRVSGTRGQVQPNVVVAPTQMVGDGAQSSPVLRKDQLRDAESVQTVIIIQKTKKPLYKRGWFVFLIFSILSTAAMPIFFKDEMHQVIEMIQTVKTTTGVDPLSIKTYTNMLHGHPTVGTVAPTSAPATSSMIVSPTTQGENIMGGTVEQAQQRAADVIQQGPQQSMQYIQEETQRLQNMAKEIDKQNGH